MNWLVVFIRGQLHLLSATIERIFYFSSRLHFHLLVCSFIFSSVR